jgi:hypothetical protein
MLSNEDSKVPVISVMQAGMREKLQANRFKRRQEACSAAPTAGAVLFTGNKQKRCGVGLQLCGAETLLAIAGRAPFSGSRAVCCAGYDPRKAERSDNTAPQRVWFGG